jgi:hypothetical protein
MGRHERRRRRLENQALAVLGLVTQSLQSISRKGEAV